MSLKMPIKCQTPDDGLTPLHVAAQEGLLEAMQWLVEQDPSLLQKTQNDDWTPLHSAAYNGHLEPEFDT